MATRNAPPIGDWTALALHWQVPGVTPSTPPAEAADRLTEWTAYKILERHGPPPGMTAEEYLGRPPE